MAIQWQLTFDCADAGLLARFWSLALGYVEADPPGDFPTWDAWRRHHGVPDDEWTGPGKICDPSGTGQGVGFLPVPEGKVVKNRLHIDVQVGGGRDVVAWEERWPRVRAKVDELVAAGGTEIMTYDGVDGRPDHVLMADPEGNEFCVV
jgi:Glyoxalase-like domain